MFIFVNTYILGKIRSLSKAHRYEIAFKECEAGAKNVWGKSSWCQRIRQGADNEEPCVLSFGEPLKII